MKKIKVKEYNTQNRSKNFPGWKSTKTTMFDDKRDAWECFHNSLLPHYEQRDFFAIVDWNDTAVETVRFDETGQANCVLYKWEGFDNDIALGWEYNGVVYNNLKELFEAQPDFIDGEMDWDFPDFLGKNDKVAHLYTKVKDDSWYKEEQEMMEKALKEPIKNEDYNPDGLPF